MYSSTSTFSTVALSWTSRWKEMASITWWEGFGIVMNFNIKSRNNEGLAKILVNIEPTKPHERRYKD